MAEEKETISLCLVLTKENTIAEHIETSDTPTMRVGNTPKVLAEIDADKLKPYPYRSVSFWTHQRNLLAVYHEALRGLGELTSEVVTQPQQKACSLVYELVQGLQTPQEFSGYLTALEEYYLSRGATNNDYSELKNFYRRVLLAFLLMVNAGVYDQQKKVLEERTAIRLVP